MGLFDRTTFADEEDDQGARSRRRIVIAFVVLVLIVSAVFVYFVYRIESWHPTFGFERMATPAQSIAFAERANSSPFASFIPTLAMQGWCTRRVQGYAP